MSLTSFEWSVIGTVAGLALSIIIYFLKRTMSKTDQHSTDIEKIKLTYVTKDELKEIRTELRDETQKLGDDIAEIKSNYLTKDDYYRTQIETNRKLDDIYKLLIKEKGGTSNGQK